MLIMVANFEKKNNHTIGRNILRYAGGVLIAGILVALVIANVKMYQKRQEFLAQVASLQNQIKNLRNSNSDLQQGISKENDPAYIEKVAREELNLQKPGETAVSFVMPPPTEQYNNQNVLQGWFGRAWEWVKSFF